MNAVTKDAWTVRVHGIGQILKGMLYQQYDVTKKIIGLRTHTVQQEYHFTQNIYLATLVPKIHMMV